MDYRLLPSGCDIERIDHDERIEQTCHDQKGVAVFVRDGNHISAPVARGARNEVRDTDTHVCEGRECHERLRDFDGKDASVQSETQGKHQGQHDEKEQTLAPAEPKMARARYRPRNDTDKHVAG
jgi:hypothetical protein